MPKQTVLDKVVVAIRALRDAKGSSRVALQKYLKAELACDNLAALKQALKKGVKDGVLVQVSWDSSRGSRRSDGAGTLPPVPPFLSHHRRMEPSV